MSERKYEINEKTIELTTCRNNFHCVSGNMKDVCEIFDSNSHPIAVTNCPKRATKCNYCKPFDGAQGFCKCPTRIELYIRYGV
jgi:hypothetical protein